MSALLADAVVVVHLAFIAFALLGGLLVLRWPRASWLHLPAAGWAVLVETLGVSCPLTPLEVRLRRAAGLPGYEGGFIERQVLPVLYPADLTRELQVALGLAALLANLAIYAIVLSRRAASAG
jgi:hypothetical protein